MRRRRVLYLLVGIELYVSYQLPVELISKDIGVRNDRQLHVMRTTNKPLIHDLVAGFKRSPGRIVFYTMHGFPKLLNDLR